MKKLFYLLLLIAGFVNGQIVNIPDANFKAKLIALGIDTDADGEIQVVEAQFPQILHLENANIDNLNGIEFFSNLQELSFDHNNIQFLPTLICTGLKVLTFEENNISSLDLTFTPNLEVLNCINNQIGSLDLSSLVNLKTLRCSNNFFSTLNLTGLSNLMNLEISSNYFATIDLSGLSSLQNFDCNFNQLTAINFEGLTNLKNVSIDNNQLNSINLTGLTNLNYLSCKNNLLTTLNIDNSPILTGLYCGNNQLTSLNVSSNTALTTLICNNNQLTSLDISSNTALISLICNNNQLTNLDITGLSNIINFSIGQNQITNFNFPAPLTLSYFDCSFNNLSQIDVSKITCDNYDFSNNPNLSYINMKNGHDDGCIVLLQIGLDYICSRFLNLPNLQFICVDEGESVGWTIPSNIIMSSYCSFTPGGNYNLITGNLRFDSNLNGCDVEDPVVSNVKVNINDGTTTGASFTNNIGNYSFFPQAGSFNVTPAIENQTWFTFSPTTATISFANNNNNTSTQDFCITPNGIHPDLEIVLAPVTPARPGFDAVYKLIFKNKGNQTLSGNVYFYYDDVVLDFVSASVSPLQSLGLLTWTYADLLPFDERSFLVTLNVNNPTETPAVNIGDVLTFNATITSSATDDTPLDNAFTYNQTVVGSFDPNDIACLEGATVSPTEIGNYLHYMVNFENTGNYAAENVVVKIEIDGNKFDVSSLQLLDSSNPVDARVTGNKIEFIFKNIQLAGPGGHGNILLKIKTKNNLVTGDMVSKNANIYFDYNAPVTTLPFDTTFQALGLNNPNLDDSIAVFPNPTSNFVTVKSKNTIKSIQLFDVQGRLLQTNFSNLKETKMDISTKASGVYFLKITSEVGVKMERIVKQ